MSVMTTPPEEMIQSIEPQRIAFAGKMGSGKSFQAEKVAKILREKYDHDVRILSLGAAIKKFAMVSDQFNCRSGCQHIGWVGRQIDPEIWVNLLRKQIEELPKTTSIIIDDIRYINEVIALKNLDFKVVLVDTSFQTRFKRISNRIKERKQTFDFNEVVTWFSHESERQFDDVCDRPSFDEVLSDDAIYADIHFKDDL